MEVVVGSYEELLLGYRLIKVSDEYQLEQSFTDHSHTGCIKTVAISKKGILASGGTDEMIQIFNLRNRRQLGTVGHHTGSILCLEFHKNTHMFSCGEDGILCIWKSFTWECLKTLRGHKSAINHLAVHPSGKLALTVGKDKTLRTWNLITGRSAYISNIKKVAEMVFWSPDGDYYITAFSNSVDVYKMETAAIHASWTTEKRINSLVFLNNKVIAYGGEEGMVFLHNIEQNKLLGNIQTNTTRIKGLTTVASLPELDDKDLTCILCTASSDGYIKLYQVYLTQDSVDSKLVASVNTDFRLTSIAVRTEISGSEKASERVEAVEDEKVPGDSVGNGDSDSEHANKIGSIGKIDRDGKMKGKKRKKREESEMKDKDIDEKSEVTAVSEKKNKSKDRKNSSKSEKYFEIPKKKKKMKT